MAKFSETIYAREILSLWKKADSIACDSITKISDRKAEGTFTVKADICGSQNGSSKFDRVALRSGVYTTQANGEEMVTVQHLARMATAALAWGKPNFQMAGFDLLHLKSRLTNPLSFMAANPKISKDAIRGSLRFMGEKDFFAVNFCVREDAESNGQLPKFFLPKHWIIGHNAQALGVLGVYDDLASGKTPVLIRVGESYFSKIPVLPGDTLGSSFRNIHRFENGIVADVVNYLNSPDVQIAEQIGLIIEFVPKTQVYGET